MPAHPQSASAEAADVRPRNTARREAAAATDGTRGLINYGPRKMRRATLEPPHLVLSEA
jgi:hypothetical protein